MAAVGIASERIVRSWRRIPRRRNIGRGDGALGGWVGECRGRWWEVVGEEDGDWRSRVDARTAAVLCCRWVAPKIHRMRRANLLALY